MDISNKINNLRPMYIKSYLGYNGLILNKERTTL